MNTYDFYTIGGPNGFYVGQAKRINRGGSERRIAEHRSGRSHVRAACDLLTAGAPAVCVGSVTSEPGYANLVEARLWDNLKARGWKPAHPRPRDAQFWATTAGMAGKKHTAETRARMSAAARGRPKSDAMRAQMSVVAKNRSPEHRARLAQAARENQRGKKLPLATRLKMAESARRAWSEGGARRSCGRD